MSYTYFPNSEDKTMMADPCIWRTPDKFFVLARLLGSDQEDCLHDVLVIRVPSLIN